MFCGQIGYKPHEFWYQLTWRQTLNISKGYQDKIKQEMDRRILAIRPLTTRVHNFLYSSDKIYTEAELMPISTEIEYKEKSIQERIENQLPDWVFQARFESAFKNKMV